jgi:hypothetical protein
MSPEEWLKSQGGDQPLTVMAPTIEVTPEKATKEPISPEDWAKKGNIISDRAEAPSGFVKGLADPFLGTAQAASHLFTGVTGYGSEQTKELDNYILEKEQDYLKQREAAGETGFDWARLGGNIINPANFIPASRLSLLSKLGSFEKVGQAAVSGATVSAMQPVTEGDFAAEKTKQVGIGAITGPIGEKVVSGAARVLKPLTSKAEQTMIDLGVQLSPGQAMGGKFNTLEQYAQVLPLVGKYITSAREKSLFDFNKAILNRPLKKLGTELPEDVVGVDANKFVKETIDKAYDDLLPNLKFNLDKPTLNQVNGLLRSNPLPSDDQNKILTNVIKKQVLSKLPQDGSAVEGKLYNGIQSDLKKEVIKYKTSSTAADRDIGEQLEVVSNILDDKLRAQNPEYSSQLRKVKSAYADFTLINQAANATNADNGVFTPEMYKKAVRDSSRKVSKTLFSTGKAQGQDIANAAEEILGKKQNVGQEARAAILAAGGYAVVTNPLVSIPAGVMATLMYSAPGRKVLELIINKRSELSKQLGQKVQDVSPEAGGVIIPSLLNEYYRKRDVNEQ